MEAKKNGLLTPPPSMREALISILKVGKNSEEFEAYQPISLMTADVKILGKV